MKNYSKEYLKNIELTRKKKVFSYVEREELIIKLNQILSELKEEEFFHLNELKETEPSEHEKAIFKPYQIGFTISTSVLLLSLAALKTMTDSELIQTVKDLSLITTMITLPGSIVLSVNEIVNRTTLASSKRELKKIDKHKSYIKALQILYKPDLPQTDRELELLYDEEEFLGK